MADVVSECSGLGILQVAERADVDNREDDEQPPPVVASERDEQDSRQNCGKQVFGADNTAHEKRLLHVSIVL